MGEEELNVTDSSFRSITKREIQN